MKTHFILVLAMTQAALAEPGDKPQAAGQGLRIAVVQQDGNPGKPEENRNKAVGFARQALDQGADVKDLAYRNSMIIAASCCCGRDEIGRACRGGSNITGATGKLLSEIWDQEGIIVADVLPGRVAAMRAKNPWYRGRRPDLYQQAIVRPQ